MKKFVFCVAMYRKYGKMITVNSIINNKDMV